MEYEDIYAFTLIIYITCFLSFLFFKIIFLRV